MGEELRVEEFKEAVIREFGKNLEHATPANVREFFDRMQERVFQGRLRERIELNEPKTTYEEILKDFFARALDLPKDEAIILLWTMAFELSFSALEHHLATHFDVLFRDMD
ncbi:MAG TPA: hypothetical protein VNJ09_01270 [Chthonomonadales bacterium]|nr:hypothetical protein [Chthonomonadales bacterium]